MRISLGKRKQDMLVEILVDWVETVDERDREGWEEAMKDHINDCMKYADSLATRIINHQHFKKQQLEGENED